MQQTDALLFPLIIYRGEKVTIDREGLHGDLFESGRWRLELSADAMIPADGDDGLRNGMPELEPIVEVGPSLEYLIDKSEATWHFRFPLRGAIDLPSLNYRGIVFHPNLAVETRHQDWDLGSSFGPLFASEGYHDYYYSVSDEYVTSTRAAYKAGSGYSGFRYTMGASRHFGDLWVGMFMRYDNLKGAVFSDSPLVEEKSSVMGGIVFSWVLYRSEKMVER